MVGNLWKVGKSWAYFLKDTGKGGIHHKDVRDAFEAVVQAVLFLGAETWVMIPMVTLAGYVGAVEGFKRRAPHHRPMCKEVSS